MSGVQLGIIKSLKLPINIDAELWKDKLQITNTDNIFDATTESATYVWQIGPLPKNEGIIAKTGFETSIYEDKSSWNLFMNYKPREAAPIVFVLMHAGRSVNCIDITFSVKFSVGRALLTSFEKLDPKPYINGDWDLWEFAIRSDMDIDPTIPDILNVLKCELTLEVKIIYDLTTILNMKEMWNTPREGPYEDLRKTLEERREHADLVVVAGEEEFYVERHMLLMRSEIFYSMYKHDVFDDVCELRIDDFNSKIVEQMLNFIYTGKVDGIEEIVFELIDLAGKYKIVSLVRKCEVELLKDVSIAKMDDLIRVAKKYDLQELQVKVHAAVLNVMTVDFRKMLSNNMLDDIIKHLYRVF